MKEAVVVFAWEAHAAATERLKRIVEEKKDELAAACGNATEDMIRYDAAVAALDAVLRAWEEKP
jgi:hypothetical protein